MLQFLGCSDLTTEQQSCLSTAVNSSYALSHLLSDVLDLSKIEAGELSAVIAPTSIRQITQLMEDLVQLYSNSIANKKISLLIDYPMEIALQSQTTDDSQKISENISKKILRRSSSANTVTSKENDNTPNIYIFYTDIMRIRQILVNLLSNAIKYTHSGFVKLQLTIASPLDQSTSAFDQKYPIQIDVSDSGEGISNDDLRNVFSRFKRFQGGVAKSEKIQRPEGTGIGLSIVKAITTKLGGEIILDSELGKGSTFSLCLPISPNGYSTSTSQTQSDNNNKNSENTTSAIQSPLPKKDEKSSSKSISRKNSAADESIDIIAPVNYLSLREISNLMSRRTLICISAHGPALLGQGCIHFLHKYLQVCCYFYKSISDYKNHESKLNNVTKVNSVPLTEVLSTSYDTLITQFLKNDFSCCTNLHSKSPFNGDFIIIDSSGLSDINKNSKSASSSSSSFEDNDSENDDSYNDLSQQVSEGQHQWIHDICSGCKEIFNFVSQNDKKFNPTNEESNNCPFVQHPRTGAYLYLVIPTNSVNLLNHLFESEIPWLSGWLPLPFIPSRLFSSILETHLHDKRTFSSATFSPNNSMHQSDVSNSDISSKSSKRSNSQPIAIVKTNDTDDENPRYHVLLVDDNKLNRKVAQKLISQVRPDIELDMAFNGKEAVYKFQSRNNSSTPFDLCLMDLRMPVLDGPSATRQIRALENSLKITPSLPIVALTAGIQSSVEEECFGSGMNDVLCKPLLKKKLEEMFAKYLPISS